MTNKGTFLVPVVETNDELELIPEKIVDDDSEEGNFVENGDKLDTELEYIVVFVLEISDKMEIISWIEAEESNFVADKSRLDDTPGNTFVPILELELITEKIVDRESEEGNSVVDGAELDTELENIVVFVLEISDKIEIFFLD